MIPISSPGFESSETWLVEPGSGAASLETWKITGKNIEKTWKITETSGEKNMGKPRSPLDWFCWENLNRKPMGFYHQI